MCGIYGSTLHYDTDQIKAKLKRTAFRGPDQMGYAVFESFDGGPVVFGHNRLSIIDLDPRSNQPFTYGKDVHLVFNGEIYNFKKVKEKLLQKGYSFKTTSDTEVICAAYKEYGTACVDEFVGMFAFVIYDKRKEILFGARDRMGQKPLYYYHNGKDFEFASQLSSIALYNDKLSISNESISYYLFWGAVPDPHSVFNEIKKLEPGNCFEFDLRNGEFKSWEYWNIDYEGRHCYERTYEEAVSELEDLLLDSVSIRLFADVPVGVFLSGGIDSSLIAAIATQSTEEKIKTFSVKFNEKGFDESKYAGQVAETLNTDHNVINCNYEEGLDLIENFCEFYDEPFSDSSAIPSMLLAKHTKRQVTVALSGDGGDESFLGYHRYMPDKRSKAYKVPYGIRKGISNMLKLSNNKRFKMASKSLALKSFEHMYLNRMTQMDKNWIDTDFDALNVKEAKYLFHSKKNILERLSDFDLKTYLNWDINTKVDRATMAFSLEARAPLMDHRIVEFARSLPTHYKYEGSNQKRILKDILYKHVPRTIFERPKAGFTMPFGEWFKGELKDYVLAELNPNQLKDIPNINRKRVSEMIQEHLTGQWNHYHTIWKLLILKQWLNNFS